MASCSICSSARVAEVDRLLTTGTPVRQVARLTGLARATLARHREHAQVTGSRLAVIRGGGGSDGPGGPLDPLAEALELSRRAKTDRELLKAAEAVRSATALEMRALRGSEADAEMLERLDANVVKAAELYRRVGGFENERLGLAGHREAIRQKLDAVRTAGTVLVPIQVAVAGQESEGPPIAMSLDRYFRGVPQRFRDPDRYRVDRMIRLAFGKTTADEELKVYEIATGAVAWVKDRKEQRG